VRIVNKLELFDLTSCDLSNYINQPMDVLSASRSMYKQ